jgi:hypothetical protein
MKYPEKRGQA